MNETRLATTAQLQQFLVGNHPIEFTAHDAGDTDRYAHISRVLKRFDYPRLKRGEAGVVLAYQRRTSGYSRAQLTRPVGRWSGNRLAATPLVKRYSAPGAPFKRKYTAEDIAFLVQTDRANGQACGAAVVHLFKRGLAVYGDPRYERPAGLSRSHLYNLRKTAGYQRERLHLTQTHPACNAIGVRRAPRPEGRAGIVRVDSMHQGDLDGAKGRRRQACRGAPHITCVDAVRQWQSEACVEGISEAFLVPALRSIIDQYPFGIKGFHSDNGHEYINGRVAKLLEKLRIEQTKSPSRHSIDNALAKSKNSSVVRTHKGYSHIPRHFAEPINGFYQETFNPWLNLHRACLFAVETVRAKGKIQKSHPHDQVKTPLEALALLDEKGLVNFKPRQSVKALQLMSHAQTDLGDAEAMRRAKLALFATFERKRKRAQPCKITGQKCLPRPKAAFPPSQSRAQQKLRRVSCPVALRATGQDTRRAFNHYTAKSDFLSTRSNRSTPS